MTTRPPDRPTAGGESGNEAERPPYTYAAIVSALVLAVYIATIAPTTQFWDTSEYIAAAKVLGIPHPPGNPLFVLLANVWGQIPLVGHYALRINLLSAIASALASGFLFLVAERFLREIIAGPRWARLAAAAAGVFVGATSFTVWNQSVVNEKVYTLSLFSIGLVLWLIVHWGDEPAGERRDHWLILIVYLLALTATNHLMGLLVIPALLVYVLYTDPAVFGRWRMWIVAFLVAAVGLSVFVFLPIRAGHYPAINEGEPTTWEALQAVLKREQYRKPPLMSRQADLASQYVNYFQYFSWQFVHDWGPRAGRVFTLLFATLGLLGAVRHWQKDRRGAVAMTTLMVTVTVALVFYLNFKYGYSGGAGADVAREVRERDYFFIASFLLWGVWVALGFGAVLEAGAAFFQQHLDAAQRWLPAAPVLLLAFVPLWGNSLTASRAGETLPRDFAVDLLQSVEPYGILITAGDNDTFPLWYAQEVEGIRRDVVVVNLSLANTPWHIRQLKRRPFFSFDSANAMAPYRHRSWSQPTEPPLSWSDEQIDALPPLYQISERRILRAGSIQVSLEPQVLERADVVTLQFIQDNIGKRPIYFSRTAGGYPDALGFTPYLLGQGFARKLMPDSIQPRDSIRMSQSLGWVDMPRTRTLLFDVYHPESAARNRPRGWVDRPSEGILTLYALVYAGYAEQLLVEQADLAASGADTTGTELAQRATDLANRIFAQTSFFR